jgi:integrase
MHLAGGQTIDPLRFTESDLDRYAKHQERGLWTEIEDGLRSSTIAHRQLAALDFRFWAASRGLSERPSFRVRVTSRKVGTSSGTRRKVSRTTLVVVRRTDPALVRFPTPAEVNLAIESASADATAQLILKLIYFCGLRASEVCNLNLLTALPDGLKSGDQYFIRVHGKNNKWRNVEIDKSLVEELQNYKINYRPDLKSRIKTDAFLLNRDGCRFSYRQLWKLFKHYCGSISPHLGRHWYAIHYLVKAWQEQQEAAAADGLYIPLESAQALLSGPLIALQLNLGHARIDTTIRTYLVGLRQVLRQDRIAITFQDYLSSN